MEDAGRRYWGGGRIHRIVGVDAFFLDLDTFFLTSVDIDHYTFNKRKIK